MRVSSDMYIGLFLGKESEDVFLEMVICGNMY